MKQCLIGEKFVAAVYQFIYKTSPCHLDPPTDDVDDDDDDDDRNDDDDVTT